MVQYPGTGASLDVTAQMISVVPKITSTSPSWSAPATSLGEGIDASRRQRAVVRVPSPKATRPLPSRRDEPQLLDAVPTSVTRSRPSR
jgi:hypothetical protein